MALVDVANKHVLLRVVLVGPAGAGKVTNLIQYALPHIRAAQAIGAGAPTRPEESPSWLREHGLELNMGQVRDFTVTLRLSAAPAEPEGAHGVRQ